MSNATGLNEVKAIYNGAEGDFWERSMGHWIHGGGFRSSMDLSERAGVAGAAHGVDLCARITRSGCTIAFTDWLAGEVPMSAEEKARFQAFMKFPDTESIKGYQQLLADNLCEVVEASDTGCLRRSLSADGRQAVYLRCFSHTDFDTDMLGAVAQEMMFLGDLARAGKLAQGRFVARKT